MRADIPTHWRRIAVLFVLIWAGACHRSPPGETRAYGRAMSATPHAPLTVAEVIETAKDIEGKATFVRGIVRKACTRKGCWMEIADSLDVEAAGCRVTFEDYSFFVPIDSAGSAARLEATVSFRHLDPSTVAHYEGEGAHFRHKLADGSAQEVHLIALGVELTRTP